MNKLNTYATILALTTLGFAASSTAMPYGNGPGDCGRGMHRGNPAAMQENDPGFMIDRMTRRLDLTPEQSKQVETIVKETQQQMNDARKNIKENRKKLHELMQQDEYNEADIRKIADELGELKSDMIVLRSQQMHKIREILTEEQRARMNDMRERMVRRR